MYRILIIIISWLLDSGGLLKYRLINIGYTVTRGMIREHTDRALNFGVVGK